MFMDYEKLLKRGMEKIKKPEHTERFVVPRAIVLKSGSRSIISNFCDIACALRREPAHLLKFLLKELATKGELQGKRLEVLGVFGADMVDRKIELYMKQYVTCPECGKPDTKLRKEHHFTFIKCEACGAKHSAGK